MDEQELEEFEFRARMEEEAAANRSLVGKGIDKAAEFFGTEPDSTAFWSGVGAVAGKPIGSVVKGGYEAISKPKTAAETPGAGKPFDPRSSGQKYSAKTGYGAGPGETVQEVVEEYKARRAPVGSGKVSKGITKNAPPTIEKYLEQQAREAREAAMRARNAPITERLAAKLPKSVQSAGRVAYGAASGVPPWLGRTVAGASLGAQAADTRNRFLAGDVRGGIISGLGALGSGMAFVPHPLVRGLGTALGTAAPMLNMYLDEPEQKATGGVVGYAKGKAVQTLKELNPFDLTKLEGKTILGTMSDRTAVDLARNLYGGPMFPRIHEGAAWGVDSPGAASRLLNAMNEAGGPKNVVVSPMLMSPGAHKSNRDVSKIALREFQKNFQEGKFGPERLAEIEMSARKIPGLESLGGLTEAEALDALNRMTFKQRGDLVERLGSKPKTAPALDLSKVLRETTEPGIEGAELGAIGPSIFTLSGHKSVNPALHGSYSQILHGDLLGEMPTIPRQFVFRNLEARALKELGRPLSDYNYRTSVGVPSQLVDEKILRSWDELGFLKPKTGGVNNPE